MASELHPLNFKLGKCVISVFSILLAFCGALVKTLSEVHVEIATHTSRLGPGAPLISLVNGAFWQWIGQARPDCGSVAGFYVG